MSTLQMNLDNIRLFIRSLIIINQWYARKYKQQTQMQFQHMMDYENPYYWYLSGLLPSTHDLIYVNIGSDTIPLNRDTFTKWYPETRSYYALNTDLFNQLVYKYPNDELYIRCCIYGIEVPATFWQTLPDDVLAVMNENADVGIKITSYDEHPLNTTTNDSQLNQPIELNAKNLKLYPKTRLAYSPPGNLYKKLINDYPDKRLTILAALAPYSPIFYLPTLDHLTLLSSDTSFLASSEVNDMLEAVQTTLYLFRTKYNISDFTMEHKYSEMIESILWMTLYLTLQEVRIKNLRTNRANPFFIWENVKSNGIVDDRSDLLDDQLMFLYRNLPYFRAHIGELINMKQLLKGLFEPYDIVAMNKHIISNLRRYTTTLIQQPAVAHTELDQEIPLVQSINNNRIQSFIELLDQEEENHLEPDFTDVQRKKVTDKFTKHITETHHPTKLIELNREYNDHPYSSAFLSFTLNTILYWQLSGKITETLKIDYRSLGVIAYFTPLDILLLIHFILMTKRNESLHPSTVPDLNSKLVNLPLPDNCLVQNVIPLNDKITELGNDFSWDPTVNLITSASSGNITTASFLASDIIDTSRFPTLQEDNNTSYDKLENAIQRIEEMFDVFATYQKRNGYVGNSTEAMGYSQAIRLLKRNISIPLSYNFIVLTATKTYESWFNAHPIFLKLLSVMDQPAILDDIIKVSLQHLLPISNSKYITNFQLTDTQYETVKTIFAKLCSMYVTFVDNTNVASTTLCNTSQVIGITESDTIIETEHVDLTNFLNMSLKES